ncbi:HesB/YadR/YfhF family protein [Paenibacillus sp. GSMTC-2017]|uniref:HesB/YadR/YfhF family protein n=1 Tax=Paenibacillus sp. GSMTC-2017 TaxID=2794350 RepID=UPI0018D9FF7C|nr:HesB/YadR/YfhF family protein [Paenibacillus sp. GSMTC-2017]MBH5320165.1 HesB/YadR/YfhF family protein [Paenibacillus sp. GSMTC-2017]
MSLVVEQAAARWYKEQMGLTDGDNLRIFVRLGGCGSYHSGLSLGITKDEPRSPGLNQTVEGITFYMENDNLWYVDNKGLRISFDEKNEEILMNVE